MSVHIHRFENESDIVYNFRKEIVINNMDKIIKDGKDINEVIKYSKIMANIKFKNCKYDQKIMDILDKYFSN
jgi:hypothetical protein